MATDTIHTANRPATAGTPGGGVPLIQLVLSGALRMRPPEGTRSPEPPRDD
jgi:hypothetical protein